MGKNVVFDEESAARIARAVKIVESWGESADEPFIEEPVQALPADRLILQGTFDGVWSVGDKKTVEYVADNGDDKEKHDVENPLQDSGVQGEKTKCIIVRVGPKWILAYAAKETVCREISSVEPSGGITLVTGVACVNGNLIVTTSTITLSDLADVTTQNLMLPKQEGCS